jgi:alpha-ketoglutarate-dependent taurine dioxygenase
MVKFAEATLSQVSGTIGHLETELKTNKEYKSKVVREIETQQASTRVTIESKQLVVTFAFRCIFFRVHFLCIFKDMIFT